MKEWFVWEKSASAKWEPEWRERLGIDAARLVLHHRPGSPVIRMEVYCSTAKEVAALIEQFGGRDATQRIERRNARFAPVEDKQLVIGRSFTVRILAEDPPPDQIASSKELWIRPARAFGTGEHATTRMCLEMLHQMAQPLPAGGWQMLDLGSGSGILALAARKFGARAAEGVDYDEFATKAARANGRLNRLRQVRFQTAELGAFEPHLTPPVECVAANLFSEVLISHLPRMRQWLKPGGHLIVSGILREQAAGVEKAGERAGFEWQQQKNRGKWMAMQAWLPN